MLSINTNSASLNAQLNLNKSQSMLQTSLQRLSSGLRINSAKDDAAGLAISDRMTSQIDGLDQAARNANDGISLAQTADGALGTATSLLQRMRSLAVQSANGTNSASDRQSLQSEVSQLQQELNRIAGTTQFNGQNILDGSLNNAQFQVGANANQVINVSIGSVAGSAIGNQALNTTTAANKISDGVVSTNAGTLLANNVAAQTLTIAGNGTTATASVAAGDTAKTIAASINATSGTTGVAATAQTTATLSGISAAGAISFKLYGANSTGVQISATVSNTNDLSSVASAINAQSSTTGITAVANTSNGKISLTDANGDDIKIQSYTGANANDTATVTGAGGTAVGLTTGAANDSVTVGGQLSLSSASAYTLTSTDTNDTVFTNATSSSSLSAVSSIDISTVTGSNNALSTIDAALSSIDSTRASLGAYENRFQMTVSNLQTTSQNLSSARSQIEDTDYAAETANMTRGQILQQAGTAILAQANSLPNSVLNLLK